MRTLATFENAYRLATVMSDRTAGDYVIIATNEPERPHRVEQADGQRDAIALVAVDGNPRIWPRAKECTS